MTEAALGKIDFREGAGPDPIMARRVVCLQIGARERYSIPRGLHSRGRLEALITDFWTPRALALAPFSGGLSDRAHPELAAARVISANGASLAREAWASLRGSAGWSRVMERNRRFQDLAVRHLDRLGIADGEATVFAYSYAAGTIFEYARRRGWRTILGQIDPGPLEERVVAEEHARRPGLAPDWTPAPEAYWRAWREEVPLADGIVVNSDWSRDALLAEGVPADRIETIPLACELPPPAAGFRRRYPHRFDAARPLRALFLGQVNLRKGMGPLLDAARLLKDAPVEFHVVGPLQISPPEDPDARARFVWHGPVPRSRVHWHYRSADVFVFPTLSDGFGITQLEARAWRLPLIVTDRCGTVAEHGVSGLVIPPGDPDAIAMAIRHCIDHPDWLRAASEAIAPGERFGIGQLAESLAAIV